MTPGLAAGRRRALCSLAALGWLPLPLLAQTPGFPTRPIRIVIPAAPGSASETIARLLGEHVGRQLGQPVIVESIGGAAGIIGTEKAMKAAADGHTLLLGFNQLVTMNPHLYPKMPYDPAKDMAPITMIQKGGFVLLVTNGLPVTDVPGLIALARSQPGKLAYASTGNGSAPHLGMELFKEMAGVDLLHVPYKGGGTAMTDLISGQVQVKIEPKVSGLAQVRAGKVRLIAVTSSERFPSLPEMPAVRETLPGFEVAGWNAIWAPAGTPAPIIARLNQEFTQAIAAPEIHRRLVEMGIEPAGSSPERVAELTQRESAQWGRLVRQLGIKPD